MPGYNDKPFAIDALLKNPSAGNGLRHLEDSSSENVRSSSSIVEFPTKERTINKRVHSVPSQYEIAAIPKIPENMVSSQLDVSLANSDYAYVNQRGAVKPHFPTPPAPRLYTADSLYDLAAIPNPFGQTGNMRGTEGRKRAHTVESREYLARIPSLAVGIDRDIAGNVRSSSSVAEIPTNERTINKRVHSVPSQYEIAAIPKISNVHSSTSVAGIPTNERTINKRVHSVPSQYEIAAIPKISENMVSSELDASLADSDYAYVNQRGTVKPHFVAPNSRNISAARTAAWVNQNNNHGNQKPYQSLHQYDLEVYSDEIENEVVAALSCAGSDTNTVDINAVIPDLFSNLNNHLFTNLLLTPVAPHNKTLNKRVVGDRSLADIHELDVSFEEKRGGATRAGHNRNDGKSCETLNKRLITQESLADLRDLPAIASRSEFGNQVLRDYSLQSLEDLRIIPSISKMSLERENNEDRIEQPNVKFAHCDCCRNEL